MKRRKKRRQPPEPVRHQLRMQAAAVAANPLRLVGPDKDVALAVKKNLGIADHDLIGFAVALGMSGMDAWFVGGKPGEAAEMQVSVKAALGGEKWDRTS